MIKKIVLAGGCFWGLEDLIRKQEGVLNTTVGYTGGGVDNPTYHNHEGHAEAVEIEYDSEKTSYKNLLDFFFQIHNPTTLNRQGNDIGASYRSAIFLWKRRGEKRRRGFYKYCKRIKEMEGPCSYNSRTTDKVLSRRRLPSRLFSKKPWRLYLPCHIF